MTKRAEAEEEEDGAGRQITSDVIVEKNRTRQTARDGGHMEHRSISRGTSKEGSLEGDEVGAIPQLERERRPWDVSTRSSFTLQGTSSGSDSWKEV